MWRCFSLLSRNLCDSCRCCSFLSVDLHSHFIWFFKTSNHFKMQVIRTSKQVCWTVFSIQVRISFVTLAFMISGELDFDDRIHNTETKAYYQVTFVIYLLFLVIMTVLVTNLLIGKIYWAFLIENIFRANVGLAVGEIPPLMKQASDNRDRLFYQLVAICEVLRYRLMWILRRMDVNDAIAYSYRDLH